MVSKQAQRAAAAAAAIIGTSLAVATQATASADSAPSRAAPRAANTIAGPTKFSYTGGEQTYTVPANVLLVGIDAAGASSADGNVGASLGGYLPVQGGQTLYAEVGQNGAYGGGATFGGGGAAGQFPGCAGCSANSAASSGAGASDVRTCSEQAASCPGGGTSDASRQIVAGGGGGAGGEGSGPGFFCTQLPQAGRAFNQQNPLPGGDAAQGPLPSITSAGIVIPGEPSDFSYGGPISDVTAATGGGVTAGTGGSLSTCTTYEVNNGNIVSAIFSPTVAGTNGTGSQGAPGASTSGTPYAAPEGSNGSLIGAGGGGGGGYTGGGGGSAGYECTYAVGGGPCYDPSPGTGGGGGASFESNQMQAPYIDDGIPGPAGQVTIAPIVEIDAPLGGADYTPGQVVEASWSCGGSGTPFQGTSCSATVPSGSPINTSPGTHTFTVTAATAPFNVNVPVSVTYTVAAAPTVTFTTPTNGASYAYGSVPSSSFTCTDAQGGPGISSCTGAVDGGAPFASGAPLPGSVGAHVLTVTALSGDGQTATATADYTVTPAATSLAAAPQLVIFPPPAGIGLGKVSATLTSGGQPLEGQTISFTAGSHAVCTAQTGASGAATCMLGLIKELEVLGNGGYTATYAAGTDYSGSTAKAAAIEFGPLNPGAASASRRGSVVSGTLRRGRRVYASLLGRGAAPLRLRTEAKVRAGRYTLRLDRGGRTITRTVTLG